MQRKADKDKDRKITVAKRASNRLASLACNCDAPTPIPSTCNRHDAAFVIHF
jgi:hypothetical protein